jgi:predicted RNase H-like HicB family nuclease
MASRTYGLYVESGPKRRKTMVHVPDLLGCIANGPTTEEALDATPEAICVYLRFLARHGESVDPAAEFRTRVVEHVMEGPFVGNGDSSIMFGPDPKVPTAAETARWAKWFGWIRTDTVSIVKGLTPAKLKAKPKPIGRPIEEILPHVIESSRAYVRSMLGPVPDLDEVASLMRKGVMRGVDAMTAAIEPTVERLKAMTTEERRRQVQHGQSLWTARKMLRRVLEHEWEHHEEIRTRLGA